MVIVNGISLVFKEFISLTISVIPYFFLSTAFGALLETYFKPGFATTYFNKGTSSVINASILGAVLPGCSCATMPMAEGLKAKGARLGVVGAFILVSPLLSPQTVILTYGVLGAKFALARVIFAFAGAFIFGLLLNFLENKKVKGFVWANQPQREQSSAALADNDTGKIGFGRSFVRIAQELGKYFLLGMLIASLLTVLIPEEVIPQYIGSSGAFAYLLAVLIGIPLYVCEGEEIPLTLALLKLGLGAGPSMAFLLGSIGTCIPTMMMAQRVVGRKPTFLYLGFWFVFALGSGLLFNTLF